MLPTDDELIEPQPPIFPVQPLWRTVTACSPLAMTLGSIIAMVTGQSITAFGTIGYIVACLTILWLVRRFDRLDAEEYQRQLRSYQEYQFHKSMETRERAITENANATRRTLETIDHAEQRTDETLSRMVGTLNRIAEKQRTSS